MPISRFIERIWKQWFVRAGVAAVSVAFAIWGFMSSAPNVWPIVVAVIGGIIALSVVANEFYQRHKLEERQRPKVDLVFDPPSNPLFDSIHRLPNGILRHVRVAARNTGLETVDNVGVMMSDCLPRVAGIFPNQHVRITHGKQEEIHQTVNAGHYLTKFFEVVTQVLDENERTTQMYVEFSRGRRALPVTEPQFMLWFVPDCASAGDPIKLVFEKNQATGQYDPRLAIFAYSGTNMRAAEP